MTHTFCVTVSPEDLGFRALHFAIHPNGESEALHGHRYSVAVTAYGPLCADGYVLDFRILEDIAYQVCKPLDRKVLLPRDNEALTIQCTDTTVTASHSQRTYCFPAAEVVILPLRNTTTELLAGHLADEIVTCLHKLEPSIYALELRIEESPGQAATVRIVRPRTADT
ncbi:MAG: 6-pyruvoyl trahydropterin synthase family protein [Egibacteraceae bacterium]